MTKRKQPSDTTIAEFLKIDNNDSKTFVTGYVYGELGINAFGIVDKTGNMRVNYDPTYTKSRTPATYGNFVRIYGGMHVDGTMLLTKRSSMFQTSAIEYGKVPKLEFTADPCIDVITKEPGLVSAKLFHQMFPF